MIVNHEHKFIFIKTRKTAGTSLEVALSAFCGPRDVITWIEPEDEAIRQSLGLPGPQNCVVPLSRSWPTSLSRVRRRQSPRVLFWNHATAKECRQYLGPRVWNRYFKFAIERNPYDRLISAYYFKFRHVADPPPMSTWVRNYSLASNWPLYTIQDTVSVDMLGKYEDLPTHLLEIGSILGIRLTLPEHKFKGNVRQDRRPYQEFLDQETRRAIEDRCHREMRVLGYSWE